MSGKSVTRIIAGCAVFCLVAMGVLYVTGTASAQQRQCGPHDGWVKLLASRHNEVQAARGLVENEIMELFISPTGSWTILITDSNKMSCLLAGGTEGFEFVAPEVAKPGRGT